MNTRPSITKFLLFLSTYWLIAALFLGASGCQTSPNGASIESPVVGFATFDGSGQAYTDGDIVVAWGDCAGTAGILVKGVWMPGVVPFSASEGGVFVASLTRGIRQSIPKGGKLPQWCARVLPPAVIQAEGFTFEAVYQGPGDVVPAPIQKSAE